jgi:hypothetical protein
MAPKKIAKKKKTPTRKKPSAMEAHTEALVSHTAALKDHTAAVANLTTALTSPTYPCGIVGPKTKPIGATTIKKYVTQVAGPAFGPQTPDNTKIVPEIRPAGDAWDFAQECMNQPNFLADGLIMGRLYVLNKCKTLGSLVEGIHCCYQHPSGAE